MKKQPSGQEMTSGCPDVVVIDYGVGNLYSITRALESTGARVEISDTPESIRKASRLILPGVGAFGDGMRGLHERGLVEPIVEYVNTGRPFLGVCLGMQLLMSAGEEFGVHRGLDIIQGKTKPLLPHRKGGEVYKIPHIGWNCLQYPETLMTAGAGPSLWEDTLLCGFSEGVYLYFCHSNIVMPDDESYCLAETVYGQSRFCSVIRKGNVYGCQFHPERSGEDGIELIRRFVRGEHVRNKNKDLSEAKDV